MLDFSLLKLAQLAFHSCNYSGLEDLWYQSDCYLPFHETDLQGIETERVR